MDLVGSSTSGPSGGAERIRQHRNRQRQDPTMHTAAKTKESTRKKQLRKKVRIQEPAKHAAMKKEKSLDMKKQRQEQGDATTRASDAARKKRERAEKKRIQQQQEEGLEQPLPTPPSEQEVVIPDDIQEESLEQQQQQESMGRCYCCDKEFPTFHLMHCGQCQKATYCTCRCQLQHW